MSSDPNVTRRYPLEEERRLSLEDPDGPPEFPAVSRVDGRIGPYKLLWKLGSGSATTVFAAQRSHERVVSRAVAVKTLRPELTKDAALVDAFLDEARIAARISHPCVCAVHDVGQARDGTPYHVMDYLVGEPFARLLPRLAARATHFSLACAVRLAIGVCEGLHAIHDARDEYAVPLHVVHGRVRPENLFAMYDGTVRVLDFGGASAADHQRLSKASTSTAGFPYMSPEQLRSERIDARSDIWSLGVVLWELLTGRRLFLRNAHVATAVAVLEDKIPSASSLNPLVHASLDAVLSRMLERDPDRRRESAREVADELEQALAYGFGALAPGKLAGWLDAVFPGCQDFRWQLVRTAPDSMPESEVVQKDPIVAIAAAGASPLQLESGLLRNLPGVTPVQPFNVTQELDPEMFAGLSRMPDSEEKTLVVQTAELMPLATPVGRQGVRPTREPVLEPRSPAPDHGDLAQLPAVVFGEGGESVWESQRDTLEVQRSLNPTTTSVLLGARRLRLVAAAAGLIALAAAGLVWQQLSSSRAAPRAAQIQPAASERSAAIGAEARPAPAPTSQVQVPAADGPSSPHESAASPAPPAAPARATQPPPPAKPVASKPVREATGQLYLTSKGGPLLVTHAGKELTTPVLLRLPESTRFIYVRRDKDEARRAVPVHVTAGEITGVSLD